MARLPSGTFCWSLLAKHSKFRKVSAKLLGNVLTRGNYTLDSYRDDAYAYAGAYFAEMWHGSNEVCECMVQVMTGNNSKKLSSIFGTSYPLEYIVKSEQSNTRALKQARNMWVQVAQKILISFFQSVFLAIK